MIQSTVFQGGGWRQLGVQTVAVVVIIGWTVSMSYVFLKLIDLTVGMRVSLAHEILGADIVEHSIGDIVYDKVNSKILFVGNEVISDFEVDTTTVSSPPSIERHLSARRRGVSNSDTDVRKRNGSARRMSAASTLSMRSMVQHRKWRRSSSVLGKHYESAFSSEEIDAAIFQISGRSETLDSVGVESPVSAVARSCSDDCSLNPLSYSNTAFESNEGQTTAGEYSSDDVISADDVNSLDDVISADDVIVTNDVTVDGGGGVKLADIEVHQKTNGDVHHDVTTPAHIDDVISTTPL